MVKIITTFSIKEKNLSEIRNNPNVDLFVFPSIEDAREDLKDAEVLVSYGQDLTSISLAEAAKLKWIQVVTAGVEKLPFQYLVERKVMLTNARGCQGGPISEYVMNAILMFSKRIPELLKNSTQHIWNHKIRNEEIQGAFLGIVGTGSLGQSIAAKAKAFGMHIGGLNTKGQSLSGFDEIYSPQEMTTLLLKSDYIAVTVPLTPETSDMFSEKEFQAMKPTAFFINVSRGEVVDESALLKALKEGWIQGAALDVFRVEPLPEDSPFWNLDNCLVTPHIAGRSPRYIEKVMKVFHSNLLCYLNDETLKTVVDLDKRY